MVFSWRNYALHELILVTPPQPLQRAPHGLYIRARHWAQTPRLHPPERTVRPAPAASTTRTNAPRTRRARNGPDSVTLTCAPTAAPGPAPRMHTHAPILVYARTHAMHPTRSACTHMHTRRGRRGHRGLFPINHPLSHDIAARPADRSPASSSLSSRRHGRRTAPLRPPPRRSTSL